jgi:predicted regulator of Ras-like GTPase activity (Roadblock/LC7/MglB family)
MDTRLQKICEDIDGAQSVFVCGYDGLILDKYSKPNNGLDVDTTAAELSTAVGKLKNNHDKLLDMILTFSNSFIAIKVFEEGFAGVIMNKDGNLGRAKLELNKMKEMM